MNPDPQASSAALALALANIAIGLFLGWQIRDHVGLEREWKRRDAQQEDKQ